MDKCTSMSVDTVEENHRPFEGIALRSNSSVVAFDPFVSGLVPRVYLPISTIRDDCDNACNNEDNVEELRENDLVHCALSSRRPR
jgi:hypothetical protein